MPQGLDATEEPVVSKSAGSHSQSHSAHMDPHRNQADAPVGSPPAQPLSLEPSPASPLRPLWLLERSLMEWAYERAGRPRVVLVLWDGTIVGDPQTAVGQIVIQQPSVLRRLFWNPNLYFGECYTEGDLLIRGDLLAVLLEVNRGLSGKTKGSGVVVLGKGAEPSIQRVLTPLLISSSTSFACNFFHSHGASARSSSSSAISTVSSRSATSDSFARALQ